MNTAVYYLSLDIHESNAQAALRVKKGDTARKLVISLTENGKPYEISNDCRAVFTARKPDGHLLYNACAVQGNRIVYALTVQTANVVGEVCCELRLYGADFALITSPRFLLLVDDTVYSDGDLVESSAEFSELTRLLNQVEMLRKEIEEALQNGDFKGDTGETSLPVARAASDDGIAYTATDADSDTALPEVIATQAYPQGKGRQIVFIPWAVNKSDAPTLRLNDGEVIPIRLRALKNRSSNELSPDATLPVPVGALMRGVPYTMTFCGKYWLVDSQVTQLDQSAADTLTKYADRLTALTDSDTIAAPIINSMDGVNGSMATMYVQRSAQEYAEPPADGNATVPTVERVAEMLRTDATAGYAAWAPPSGTDKSIESYAKTLPDGRYSVKSEYGLCFVDVFTEASDTQWRMVWYYTDEYCFFSVFCGEELTFYYDGEAGKATINGKKALTENDIPFPAAGDAGKVLTVDETGAAAWMSVKETGTVGVTEKLTIVPSASYPNITTFEYTESAAPEQYVIAKAGKLQGGLLRVDFDPNDIVNFDLNLYVFDSLGRPYKQTNFSERIAESGGFRGDDYSPTWKDPGVGESFGEVVSPFSVQIPDGCAVMVCMRRGWEHVTSPNGTITTNAQFAQWAVNGGIKITVTVPTITVDTKLSEASGNAIANSSVTAAVNLLHMTSNVKAIAHRGLAGSAPENTLSAYKIARKKGFEYAECDVSFTADGAAVLLHDDTVDRTSDGTGSIGAMTFAQARTLDFGSWYDEKFAGERIPLFSEFISLCRAIGLHPYIELKPTGATQERVASLVATVKRYGMARRVTWISFYSNLLEFVKLADPSARLGYVTEAATTEAITAAVSTIQAMQTDTNEVFCDTDINSAGMVSAMRNADIPLEFWTANTEAVLKTLDPYFSGVTSDCLHFGRFLYETNGATA